MVCVNPMNYVLILGLDNGTMKANFAEPHFPAMLALEGYCKVTVFYNNFP